MSLSGNLGFVSIDEVLRLLMRSRQEGSVNVTGSGLRGRVFVGKGGIDLATTSDNDELHRHLLSSGYADEKTLSRVTSGETTLAAVAEGNHGIIDLLREMTVESLYQMASRGTDFSVHEGATTPYASPKSFDLESLLADAEERMREWDRVREVIADLGTPVEFSRDLGDREEVTLKIDDWKVLSEIGAGSSVTQIADRLGTTEFWTARVTARLVKNDLIILRGTSEVADDHRDVADEPEPDSDYVRPRVDYYTDDIPESSVFEDEDEDEEEVADQDRQTPVFTDESTVDEPDPDVASDESWWQEPREEEETVEDDDTPAVVSEGLSEIPTVEGTKEDAHVEGDTEAFLEKVFSELESSEQEGEEGHGLLRRRRMGTLRDFSSDS